MENNAADEPKKDKPDKDKNKKWLMWLLIALVVLMLALAGWLWWQLKASQDKERQLEQDKRNLQELVDGLKDKQAASVQPAEEEAQPQACNDTPSAAMKDNIKAALDSKNTAAFSTYTTDPVKYVLAASEYGGDVSPDEAATSLEYTHGATGPWDFNLPAATVDGYDAGFYTDYFDDNTYVGRAASGMVAAFDFDCNGKIKQIFVAGDEDLL